MVEGNLFVLVLCWPLGCGEETKRWRRTGLHAWAGCEFGASTWGKERDI